MKRFKNLTYQSPDEVGIIILGDAGCNYYKNGRDRHTKMDLEKTGCNFYLVRGNHEERPQNVDGMMLVYDADVQGDVYVQEDYPHIKYLKDGGVYMINGHRTLVIGGAYSVDKWYRLQMGYHWFAQEQLTTDEMETISREVFGEDFDFVLTHTCPIGWEPTDLFLGSIDQSTVDKSMELWMDKLKDEIHWKVWLWAHYHTDRAERPGCEIFYRNIEDLNDIMKRWDNYFKTGELEWWIRKGPKFYENKGQN